MDSDTYYGGGIITGIIIFIGVWLYAMAEWGFLLGIVFGWIPAIIAAFIGGLIWPVLAGLLVILIIFILIGL